MDIESYFRSAAVKQPTPYEGQLSDAFQEALRDYFSGLSADDCCFYHTGAARAFPLQSRGLYRRLEQGARARVDCEEGCAYFAPIDEVRARAGTERPAQR